MSLVTETGPFVTAPCFATVEHVILRLAVDRVGPMTTSVLKSRTVRHLLIWVGSWVAFFLMVRFNEGPRSAYTVTTSIMLAGPLPVYTHFAALSRFFERRRYVAYCVSLAVIMTVSAFWAEFVHSLIDRDPSSHTNGLGVSILFLTFSTGFRYFQRGMTQQFRVQEAESKQLRTEMALLRSQINPHFILNTLNGLYALSLDRSERVPDVIERFSELMRYLLDSSHQRVVPLANEIRFIENYIELEKLRLDKDVDVRLRVVGDPGTQLVAPMLMVPVVENCFKHGVSGDHQDSHIHIDIIITDSHVHFTAENNTAVRSLIEKNPVHGTGLKNLQRRLALLYPGRHRLAISEEQRVFRVEMMLWL
jgi:sensor histidine kinase YesM